MSPMIDPPDPRDLDLPPHARLPARRILTLSISLFGGILLLLVLPVALAGPEGGAWMSAGALTLGFLLSLHLLLEMSLSWNNPRQARCLPPALLPDIPGIGHDRRHAYVVERHVRRWHRLARRPR